MNAGPLPPDWYCEVVADGVCNKKPGIYRWEIEGAGVYIGRYTKIGRPRHEYRRNVERILRKEPSHHRDGKFRCVHRALAAAVNEKRCRILTILANAEPCDLNRDEQKDIRSERANPDGRGAMIDVSYTLAPKEPVMTVAELLFEEAKRLPAPLAKEALDFVLFLRGRQEQAEWRDLMDAQSSSLASIWDNDEDEAWNNV